jgi:glycosyltransferase involved in cell wall biosynthesis
MRRIQESAPGFRPRILVLAQTPPPFHGQSIMQAILVNHHWDWCIKEHVRLDFSKSLKDVGKFSIWKALRLACILLEVAKARLGGVIDILYYPPGGSNRIPFWRDLFLLIPSRWLARKLVLHFHSGGFGDLPKNLSSVERALAHMAYGRAHVAIVNLPGIKEEIAWILPKRIAVVTNGIEPVCMTHLTARDRCVVVLLLGTMSEEKGVVDIVRMIPFLTASQQSIRIRLVGEFADPACEKSLRQLLPSPSATISVEIVGPRYGEEKWREFFSADIFCLPTAYENENLPLVLLEAMQASLPIVSTRWRHIPEVVRDGVDGFLVPIHDPKALAERLLSLVEDPDLRARIGQNGRRHFEEQYTSLHHLAQMEQAFQFALED